jgi:hypothetical protein
MRDHWVGGHPRGGGFGLPVRQQINDLVRVQVYHDRAERSPTLKGKVVVAQTRHMFCWRGGQSHHPAHNRHPGRGDSQMRGQSRAESAARRQADGLQRLAQTGRHLGPRSHQMGQPFSENLLRTLDGVTKELADVQNKMHLLPCTGQIFHHPAIPTMQAAGELGAQRTQSSA